MLRIAQTGSIVNSSEKKALVVDSLEEKIVVQTDKTSTTFPLGNDQAIKQIAKAVLQNWRELRLEPGFLV